MQFDFGQAFLTVLVTAVIAGALLAWMWIVDRWRHRLPLLPQEPHAEAPWEAIDLIMAFAVWLVLQAVCVEMLVSTTGTKLPSDPGLYSPRQQVAVIAGQMIGSLGACVFVVMFIRFRTGASLADLGFDFAPASNDVKVGAVAFVAIAPVVYSIQAVLTQLIPYKHAVVSIVDKKPSTLVLSLLGLSTILTVPLVEEFLFRVLLQGWLEKFEKYWIRQFQARANEGRSPSRELATNQVESAANDRTATENSARLGGSASAIESTDDLAESPKSWFGFRPGFWPIIVSSTLFALVHYGQGPAIVPLFVFALVLGFLYQRTHRIIPSMTVHGLLNAVTMVMLFAGGPAQQ